MGSAWPTSRRASRTISTTGSTIRTRVRPAATIAGLIERAGAGLALSSAQDGALLAVTHGAFVRVAMVSALDADCSAFWRIDVAPLTLARLSGREGRWNLVSLSPLGAPS